MKPRTLQCKDEEKEHAQSESDTGYLRQSRCIHLSREYFLQVLQKIRKFRNVRRRAVLGGVKWAERKVITEGRCIYMARRQQRKHPAADLHVLNGDLVLTSIYRQSGRDGQQATGAHRGRHISKRTIYYCQQ